MPIDASPSGTLDIENATLRSREIVALTNMVAGNDVVRADGPALEVYGDPGPRLELVSNTAATDGTATFTRLESNVGVFSIQSGTDGATNGPITFGGFQNERMRITADGNVGIGTNAPDGKIHTYVPNPTDFTGITHQSSDVKAVITNDNLSGTNASTIQVYKGVFDRTPSTGDFHSETSFSGSNVYTLSLNPRGGRIGLNDLNPNSDLTMGARIYNTTGYVGLVGDDSDPIIYKGNPATGTVTLPYTQLSTSNPTNGPAYYFINPYKDQEAQCTVVYDNAQSSANGVVYFYQNGPNYQPSATLANSSLGLSEFTIPLPETGTLRGRRVNAVHMKPVNGTQIRIVAVYWVPYRGVTANIKDGGKLVLGTVGGFGTPEAGLTFRREYETPTGNQLEPTQRLDNGIAWMTDLSTWYNSALGGNGINWSKNNNTYGVSVGARIWYQPGSFISAGGGAGNCGSLYLSAGHNTSASNTPNIAIKSNGNVGIGLTNPSRKLHVGGNFYSDHNGSVQNWSFYDNIGSDNAWRTAFSVGATAIGLFSVLSYNAGFSQVNAIWYYQYKSGGTSGGVVRISGSSSPTFRMTGQTVEHNGNGGTHFTQLRVFPFVI